MLKDAYPYYLANEAVFANQDLDVTDKYSGEVATRVAMADAATIDKAIDAADKAAAAMAKLAPYERQAILYHCVKRFEERYDELALALCIEAGKPIKDARGEVGRLIDTFRVAAEEAVRIDGEMPNLEISARAKGYRGMVKRVPIGPCSFISPFNFPLNLALALLANYPEFPDSWFFLQFTLLEHIAHVLVDGSHVFAKQLRHLDLAEPDRFLIQRHFQLRLAIG